MTHLLSTLREVSLDRHKRAVQGLRDSTLTVTVGKQSDSEIRAVVRTGEAKEYRVIINDAGAICSCPDSLYRGVVCKHATAVALYVLRTPQAAAQEPEAEESQAVNLKLTKTRPGWTAAA